MPSSMSSLMEVQQLIGRVDIGADIQVGLHDSLGLARGAGGENHCDQVVRLDAVQSQQPFENQRRHGKASIAATSFMGGRDVFQQIFEADEHRQSNSNGRFSRNRWLVRTCLIPASRMQ